MDSFMQLLLNPNHEMPSGWVLLALAVLAIAVPALMRYLQGWREENRRNGKRKK